MTPSRRQILAGTGLTLAAASLSACGTIMYPERKGQIDGKIDPTVAILNGVGLLLFLVGSVPRWTVANIPWLWNYESRCSFRWTRHLHLWKWTRSLILDDEEWEARHSYLGEDVFARGLEDACHFLILRIGCIWMHIQSRHYRCK
jgi:hypothetical protein